MGVINQRSHHVWGAPPCICLVISIVDGIITYHLFILVGGLEHFFHMLGMSSSQLPIHHIFQRGRYTTNQIVNGVYKPTYILD